MPAIAQARGGDHGDTKDTTLDARAEVSQIALRSELIFKMLRDSRHNREEARVQCLDDVLSQAHAVEHRAEEELDAIAKAARERDEHAIHWRGARLKLLAARSSDLVSLAKRCGKSDKSYKKR